MQAHQHVVEQRLRLPRRVLAVVDVAGHHEGVDLVADDDGFEMGQRPRMLVGAGIAAQGLPDMPVAGMQHADHVIAPTSPGHRLCGPEPCSAPPPPVLPGGPPPLFCGEA